MLSFVNIIKYNNVSLAFVICKNNDLFQNDNNFGAKNAVSPLFFCYTDHFITKNRPFFPC